MPEFPLVLAHPPPPHRGPLPPPAPGLPAPPQPVPYLPSESYESTGGGSYSPPSEFRSEVTDAGAGGEEDIQFRSASAPGSPSSGSQGHKSDKTKAGRGRPWIGGEVCGKANYRVEPKIR